MPSSSELRPESLYMLPKLVIPRLLRRYNLLQDDLLTLCCLAMQSGLWSSGLIATVLDFGWHLTSKGSSPSWLFTSSSFPFFGFNVIQGSLCGSYQVVFFRAGVQWARRHAEFFVYFKRSTSKRIYASKRMKGIAVVSSCMVVFSLDHTEHFCLFNVRRAFYLPSKRRIQIFPPCMCGRLLFIQSDV